MEQPMAHLPEMQTQQALLLKEVEHKFWLILIHARAVAEQAEAVLVAFGHDAALVRRERTRLEREAILGLSRVNGITHVGAVSLYKRLMN